MKIHERNVSTTIRHPLTPTSRINSNVPARTPRTKDPNSNNSNSTNSTISKQRKRTPISTSTRPVQVSYNKPPLVIVSTPKSPHIKKTTLSVPSSSSTITPKTSIRYQAIPKNSNNNNNSNINNNNNNKKLVSTNSATATAKSRNNATVTVTKTNTKSVTFNKKAAIVNHNNNIVISTTSRLSTLSASPLLASPKLSYISTKRGGQGQTASSKVCNTGGGALKEASSISSLDSKHKIAPIHSSNNKVTKASSKEKLDKINVTKNDKTTSRHNEIRGNHKVSAPPPPPVSASVNNSVDVLKNNNRIDLKETIAPPLPPVAGTVNGDVRNRNLNEPPASLPPTSNLELNAGDIAMQDLASVQEQLEIMARENAAYQEEIRMLISEKKKLQNQIQLEQIQHAAEIEQLTEENSTLRNRLRDVAHSPLSDNEKQQLLMEPTQRQHNSAPASFAATCENEGSSSGCSQNAAIIEPPSSCPTPDWDKHSSSSMSEVSVACLQDRILQMEETHYSTNEELQATLQELADLQAQLAELQNENERLLDEKTVLLESLCRQTEKLEDSRATVDTLQELLVRGDGYEQKEGGTEREQKLVELLKAAQEERETLLLKQTEMTTELHELRQSAALQMEERERLIDRVRLLESTVDSVHAERKLIDQELAQVKEQDSARRIEISRLTTLLENARAKIDELEKERDQGARSEMDALLDTARKEKDTLESHVATLQGQVSRGQCEKERLQEQLSLLQEECKVAKNNAKSVISDLEYQLSEVRREITSLRAELQASKDSVLEAQSQAQRHLEDKRNLKAILAEVQRQLTELEERLKDTEEQLNEEQRLRREENNEWEQFQRDLLMTVRVANDFKTEAQAELEKLVHENKALRDKVRGLEAQLEKLKAAKPQTPPLLRQSSVPVDTQQSLFTSVQQEMAARRQKAAATRQDSRLSVKSLIESIENATKQVKAGPGGSRSSSTSSLNSSTSDIRSVTITPATAPITNLTTTSNMSNDEVFVKSPLREQQQIVSSTNNNNKSATIKTNGKNLICGDVGKPEDTFRESVALLSAKNIDFVRRNSYGDLSERKDPLSGLPKNGGSKRNALLKWCQQKTVGYRNIDITNFSSSWNDGLALCALLHTYLPDRVPYDTLVPTEKRRNFSLAFSAAESVGIPTTLNINDMCQLERPDWQQVMAYVTAIYKHFET